MKFFAVLYCFGTKILSQNDVLVDICKDASVAYFEVLVKNALRCSVNPGNSWSIVDVPVQV